MTKPIDTDALRALAGRAPAEIEHVQYGEPYVEPICNEFYEAAREAVPALLDRLRELEGALREACDLGSATEAPRGTGAGQTDAENWYAHVMRQAHELRETRTRIAALEAGLRTACEAIDDLDHRGAYATERSALRALADSPAIQEKDC